MAQSTEDLYQPQLDLQAHLYCSLALPDSDLRLVFVDTKLPMPELDQCTLQAVAGCAMIGVPAACESHKASIVRHADSLECRQKRFWQTLAGGKSVGSC